MPPKLRNIVEDIARDYLDSALTLRYDICTCELCKNDMLAYILSRVPARYVTTEEGALHTIIQQHKVECQAAIARVIIEAIGIIGKNPRHEVKEDTNRTFQMLLDKIKEDRGLDFRHYHQDLLKRRVAIRLRTLKINTYSEYLRLLISTPKEYDNLFETLCINVSEFFRDPEVWVTVRSLFRDIIAEKKQEHDPFFHIWSAGCANGEEPYSLAITLKEALKDGSFRCHSEVTATDVDEKCMRFAQKGAYGRQSLKNVDKGILERYFIARGLEHQVCDEIRSLVKFQYLDLTSPDFVRNADVVFCRNVFIYFDRSLQEQLLMKFYNALKPRGYLVMGKSETLISEAKHIFEEISFDARLYRKKAKL